MVDQTFFSAAAGGPINADRHDKLPGVPMISKFDDGGAVPMPQGFGGGAPDQQATNQPPPPDIPQQDPQWGQSLGQDVGNVGSAIKGAAQGAVNTVGGAVNDLNQSVTPPPTEGGAQSLAPRIMNYLTGHGAMDKQQWDSLNSSIDQAGTMDQNERTMRAIDAATQQSPDLGAAALQHARQNYDLYKANAAKELHGGNDTLAAQEANMAQNYVPDGSKTIFAPVKDGFAAKVQSSDGNSTTYQLSKEQFNSMLNGEHSLFDHVGEAGADAIIQAATKAGGTPLPGAQGSTEQAPFSKDDADRPAPSVPKLGARDPDTPMPSAPAAAPPRQGLPRPANDGSDGSRPVSSPNFHRTPTGVTSLETPEEGEEREFVRHRDDLRAAKGLPVDKTVDHSFGGSAPNAPGARGTRSAQGRGGSEGHATALQNAFGAYRDFLKANPNASQEDKDAALKDNGIDPAKYRQGGYFAQQGGGRQSRSVLDQPSGQNQVHDIPAGHGPNDLIPGRIYKNAQGQSAKWDGRQFIPVGG